MEKTDKKILEEMIRVDHAGERGAIKIYEGQLLALKTLKQDEILKDKIEKMKDHEKEHLEYFEKVTKIITKMNNFYISEYTKDLHNSVLNNKNILTEFEMLFKSKDNPSICYLLAKKVNNNKKLIL